MKDATHTSQGSGAMEDCKYLLSIAAYHDGELEPSARIAIEKHLTDCPVCAGELDSLRRLSAAFSSAPIPRLSDMQVARLRRSADAFEDRSPIHFAGGLLALAASIVVVAAVWWKPAAPQVGVEVAGVGRVQPEWEKVASTLRVEPMIDRPRDTALADAHLADWMLDGLAGGGRHGHE